MLHNEFHIMEPVKVEMLCTLVDVNSLSIASSLTLISNNTEVLTVTDTIDVLITPKSPLTCHEILNLTIPFRESNGPSFRGAKVWGRSQCLEAIIGVHLYFTGVIL